MLSCLVVDREVVAFSLINRDENLLAESPPAIVLQFNGEASTTRAILKLKTAQTKDITVIQMDTPVFSYEPVLKALKEASSEAMPLFPELVSWTKDSPINPPPDPPRVIIRALNDPRLGLNLFLKTPKPISLDMSQAASLSLALTQRVSLIQGPPGTLYQNHNYLH